MLKELRAKAIVVGLFVASLPLLGFLKVWQLATRQARDEDLEDLDTWAQGHPLTHPEPKRAVVVDLVPRPWTQEEQAELERWWKETMAKRAGTFVASEARFRQEGLPFDVKAVDDPVHGLTQEKRAEVRRWWTETVNKRVGMAVFPARPNPRCKCPEPEVTHTAHGDPYCKRCDLDLPSQVPQPEIQKRYINTDRCKCAQSKPVKSVGGLIYCKRCDLDL